MNTARHELPPLMGPDRIVATPNQQIRMYTVGCQPDTGMVEVFMRAPNGVVIDMGTPWEAVECLAKCAANIVREYPYSAKRGSDTLSTRPGAHVPGLGWVSSLNQLSVGDTYRHGNDHHFSEHEVVPHDLRMSMPVVVVRYADGTHPPVPPGG